MEPAILTIVRHGETSANIAGVWHGSIDTALTPRGVEQARRAADAIGALAPRASALYASPLRRARDTARSIGLVLGLEARVDADLAEYHLGELEGRTYGELMREHRLFERMAREPDWNPGGGESPRQVATRGANAMSRIAAAHPGERVVVVSHGGALTLTLSLLLDGDISEWKRVMDNCAITELALDPSPRLLTFNEVAHLA
jgi:broad specificity phosphatase PhoE